MKVVPKLKKEKLEDAKKILEEAGILYEEDEEKEFSLSVRRGRVTRTEPKEETEIKNKDKVTIYVSRLWLLPIILIFLILILLMFINIGISSIYTNNRPIIDSIYKGWVKSNTVYVKRDVDVSEVDTYLYCVTKEKSKKKCKWEETDTKNVLLSETGKWNVYFKARYKNGKYSFVSNREEVLIDNDAPIVKSINKNASSATLSFNIKAEDKGSGIKKYSYKIGNKEYVDVNSKFNITDLKPDTEYTITVRVEDKAGNVYEVTFTEKTKEKENENNDSENNGTTNPNDETTSNGTTNPNDKTQPTELTRPTDLTKPSNTTKSTTKSTSVTLTKTTKSTSKTTSTNTTKEVESTDPTEKPTDKPTEKPTETTEKTKPTKPVEPEVEIPKIDLNDLPAVFEYGSKYNLPSHVEFGPSGGTYSCALNHDWSKNIETTEDLAVGEYTISCKAVSTTGAYAEVSKEIKVSVPKGEDEEWDGWIRLNLYYPAGSTNREWRLHREGEIRGEDDNWQAYTGPILVKVSDISNVYIRYDLDGEEVIETPAGKVLVDIKPNELTLDAYSTTKVNITYDNNAKTKEYRINGGAWTSYKGEFSVSSDTLIEARATREEKVYDSDGNYIMDKTLSGTDSIYISQEGEPQYDFGEVEISIIPDRPSLKSNETTNVNIIYEEDSTNRLYKIDDGAWKEYTGPFKAIKNQTIYAKAESERTITLVNGIEKIGKARGNVKKKINDANDQHTYTVEVYGKTPIDNSETSDIFVNIDKNIFSLEYSVNGSEYQVSDITSPGEHQLLTVNVNTLINVKATYKGYDQETYIAYDSLYVSENKNSLRVSIKPTKSVLASTDKTDVMISTNYETEELVYRLNNGSWTKYNGNFKVSKNTLIEARAIKKNTDGTKQVVYASKYIDNINLEVFLTADTTRVLKDKKAKVRISSNIGDAKLYYSLDNQNYKEYAGSFEVSGNTTIYAKAESLNPDGSKEVSYDTLSIDVIEIKDILSGPNITHTPTALTEEVTVTISTNEEAGSIYYSIDGNSYQEYTSPFTITKNSTIASYYVRKNDGKVSKTTYHYIQNIKVPQKPYVRIDARPSTYLSENVDMVEITLSGTDYNTLEYSYNGIEYFTYTEPLQITQSTSVYAKGTNAVGTTIEKINITTKTSPVPLEKLDVAITLSPEQEEVEDLIDKVEVTINYDSKATSRYYRIGDGELQKYTGPFVVKENTTIYAYAISDKGKGEANAQINYLTTGIANPTINVNPKTPVEWVRVEIDYAPTSSVKKYKLDNGEWLDYNGPIELIVNNTKISAYNEDTLGHHSEAEVIVDNIVPRENISVLDNGMYYLIKLNYPASSKVSDREYKWKADGTWKKYDEHGILLIKQEYADKLIGTDGVKITDSNGKEVVLKDHYYILDVPLSEMAGNIFMRWDLSKPKTPTFILSNESWTKEVTVGINYDKVSVEKLYKIVYEDGTDTGWLSYEKPIKITDNNAIIYAKSSNEFEIQSDIASKKITNIDQQIPEVSDIDVLKTGTSNITIKVNALDDVSGIDTYMYSLDNKDFDETNKNTYTFSKLKNNKSYKVYIKVKDKAGNISEVFETTITTIDIGDIAYNLDKEEWAVSKVLTITYPTDVYNGYEYQYSLDLGENWLTYENPLSITENNTTVIARVVDGDNIKVASTFTVTKIDSTEPTISLDGMPSLLTSENEEKLPTSFTDGPSGSEINCTVDGRNVNYTIAGELPIGNHTLTCKISLGNGLSAETSKDYTLTATIKKGDSILDILNKEKLKTGYYYFEVPGKKSTTVTETIENEDGTTEEIEKNVDVDFKETYPIHMITFDGNQEWNESQVFGDAGDVGTAYENAQNMVIVKVNGDLKIGEGATISPYYNEYGGPKGFTLYVTGKLENNGIIDNSHGAKAEGQDVYLWKNADGTYEYVPAAGAIGGDIPKYGSTGFAVGKAGTSGTGRQTGGGGSAGVRYKATGAGGTGTSYASGVGGTANANGASKTAGLLILFANEFKNNGTLKSTGYQGSTITAVGKQVGGGSSGSGSINIFTNQSTEIDQLGIITNTKYNEMLGKISINGISGIGSSSSKGGAGGSGTINIGGIRNNQYYDLKAIIEQDKEIYKNSVTRTGESILSILSDNTLTSGYWYFKVNNEEYPVHLYVLEGDQNWTESQTFGDDKDVSDGTNYAQNMVIVKVNGNVTVGSGATVQPYYNEYGGPKGFTLYVTGKLENNGIIDNSHGAKAEGQDVYLWKNADGTYEYVPAAGAIGGDIPKYGSTGFAVGKAGTSGTGRQTGGGGSAAVHYKATGAGGTGTSYASGVGGTANANGASKTAGLLILFANEFKNNGTLKSTGYQGSTTTVTGNKVGGGSSGGGSINVFSFSDITDTGTINKNGGAALGSSVSKGGAGGSGTVTYTQIDINQVSSTSNNDTDEVTYIPNPTITLDSTAEASSKVVTINYTSGFTNEYSLDLGESWTPYQTPITITNNLTVIARTRSGDKVLSSSSFTITKIKEEDTNIPNEFIEGEDYKLPENCLINDTRYGNINELVAGSYNLVCELTNGDNPLVNKTIIVKKREDIILEG